MNEKLCPKCNSHSPNLHPAMQYEGEVQICSHPWHKRPIDENVQVGQLRVWHHTPGTLGVEPFFYNVLSYIDAITILDSLAEYDEYRFEKEFDWTEHQGLQIYDGCGIWPEWENEKGENIHVIMERI